MEADIIGCAVDVEFRKRLGFNRTNKCFEHKPENVLQIERFDNFNLKANCQLCAWGPDLGVLVQEMKINQIF